MKNRSISAEGKVADSQRMTSAGWNVAAWVLALGAFAVAMFFHDQTSQSNRAYDLRTPGVLLLDAFLATAVAFKFAVGADALKRWPDAHLCLRFGLWSAAVFRLVPYFINEEVVYFKNMGTIDAPYVVLGACIHGGLALVLTWPYGVRVLDLPAVMADGESLKELCGAVILIFFIVAGSVRLLAEPWALG